jgi:hypothetical protein
VIYGVLDDELNWELAENFGPHTTGKGCLYFKDLPRIDTAVLGEMIDRAFLGTSSE